jgi:hypothetical protein
VQRRHHLATPSLRAGTAELSFQRKLGKAVDRRPGHGRDDLRLPWIDAALASKQFLDDNISAALAAGRADEARLEVVQSNIIGPLIGPAESSGCCTYTYCINVRLTPAGAQSRQ